MLDRITGLTTTATIAGIETELVRRGDGRALLFLHPEIGLAPEAPAIDALAQRFEVIAPSHPGFGHSDLPQWMTTVEDLSYFYLALMETLGLDDVTLVGNAFGGWIAAELAVKQPRRVSRLVLVNPAGIKLSSREQRDMADIFSLPQRELDATSFHDPRNARHFDPKTSSEDDIYVELRNRESAARFAWSPYMHNPHLVHRLHLVRVPTLVLWGEGDRIASIDYGRRYAEKIPGARFATIAAAGRYPHLEQPEAFARAAEEFAREQ
jgi:pimeloyl-ACP methyl ester carboxylesterase